MSSSSPQNTTVSNIIPKIVCENCKRDFDVPKLLPCGESVCDSCLTEFCNNNKSKIKCPFCEESHKVPKSGFPTQKLLQNLLSIGTLNDSVRASIDNTEHVIKDLTDSYDTAQSKVKSHCEFMKSEIEISVESTIDELNQLKLKMFDEIDIYEQSRLENIEKDSVEKRNFKEHLDASLNRLNRLKELFERNELNESEQSEIPKEMVGLQNKLKTQKKYI